MTSTEDRKSVRARLTRHRRPVMLVAGLVVVGLVVTAVGIWVLAPGPKDVVEDYLDAIRDGDTETALEIAGEPDAGGRPTFLSAAAVADDWTVDVIVERHRSDDEADVDVTISTGDDSEQGRFHLVDGDDGWTIETPFVVVDLPVGDLDTVELGGERHEVERTGDGQAGTAQVVVFPGAYEVYPGLADRITVDPATIIAPPQPPERTVRAEMSFSLTDEGTATAQQAIDDFVDDCAAEKEISPPDCPFSAENFLEEAQYEDALGVTWTLVTRPEAHFVPAQEGVVDVVVRRPGLVRVTGTAVPEYPEGRPRTRFTAECEFGVETMSIAPTPEGFTVEGTDDDAVSTVSLETRCY